MVAKKGGDFTTYNVRKLPKFMPAQRLDCAASCRKSLVTSCVSIRPSHHTDSSRETSPGFR